MSDSPPPPPGRPLMYTLPPAPDDDDDDLPPPAPIIRHDDDDDLPPPPGPSVSHQNTPVQPSQPTQYNQYMQPQQQYTQPYQSNMPTNNYQPQYQQNVMQQNNQYSAYQSPLSPSGQGSYGMAYNGAPQSQLPPGGVNQSYPYQQPGYAQPQNQYSQGQYQPMYQQQPPPSSFSSGHYPQALTLPSSPQHAQSMAPPGYSNPQSPIVMPYGSSHPHLSPYSQQQSPQPQYQQQQMQYQQQQQQQLPQPAFNSLQLLQAQSSAPTPKQISPTPSNMALPGAYAPSAPAPTRPGPHGIFSPSNSVQTPHPVLVASASASDAPATPHTPQNFTTNTATPTPPSTQTAPPALSGPSGPSGPSTSASSSSQTLPVVAVPPPAPASLSSLPLTTSPEPVTPVKPVGHTLSTPSGAPASSARMGAAARYHARAAAGQGVLSIELNDDDKPLRDNGYIPATSRASTIATRSGANAPIGLAPRTAPTMPIPSTSTPMATPPKGPATAPPTRSHASGQYSLYSTPVSTPVPEQLQPRRQQEAFALLGPVSTIAPEHSGGAGDYMANISDIRKTRQHMQHEIDLVNSKSDLAFSTFEESSAFTPSFTASASMSLPPPPPPLDSSDKNNNNTKDNKSLHPDFVDDGSASAFATRFILSSNRPDPPPPVQDTTKTKRFLGLFNAKKELTPEQLQALEFSALLSGEKLHDPEHMTYLVTTQGKLSKKKIFVYICRHNFQLYWCSESTRLNKEKKHSYSHVRNIRRGSVYGCGSIRCQNFEYNPDVPITSEDRGCTCIQQCKVCSQCTSDYSMYNLLSIAKFATSGINNNNNSRTDLTLTFIDGQKVTWTFPTPSSRTYFMAQCGYLMFAKIHLHEISDRLQINPDVIHADFNILYNGKSAFSGRDIKSSAGHSNDPNDSDQSALLWVSEQYPAPIITMKRSSPLYINTHLYGSDNLNAFKYDHYSYLLGYGRKLVFGINISSLFEYLTASMIHNRIGINILDDFNRLRSLPYIHDLPSYIATFQSCPDVTTQLRLKGTPINTSATALPSSTSSLLPFNPSNSRASMSLQVDITAFDRYSDSSSNIPLIHERTAYPIIPQPVAASITTGQNTIVAVSSDYSTTGDSIVNLKSPRLLPSARKKMMAMMGENAAASASAAQVEVQQNSETYYKSSTLGTTPPLYVPPALTIFASTWNAGAKATPKPELLHDWLGATSHGQVDGLRAYQTMSSRKHQDMLYTRDNFDNAQQGHGPLLQESVIGAVGADIIVIGFQENKTVDVWINAIKSYLNDPTQQSNAIELMKQRRLDYQNRINTLSSTQRDMVIAKAGYPSDIDPTKIHVAGLFPDVAIVDDQGTNNNEDPDSDDDNDDDDMLVSPDILLNEQLAQQDQHQPEYNNDTIRDIRKTGSNTSVLGSLFGDNNNNNNNNKKGKTLQELQREAFEQHAQTNDASRDRTRLEKTQEANIAHPPLEYELVVSCPFWDMGLCIFVRRPLVHLITDRYTETVATGLGNVIGNKGAVCSYLRIAETPMLFISSHFAAREERTATRNLHYQRILHAFSVKLSAKLPFNTDMASASITPAAMATSPCPLTSTANLPLRDLLSSVDVVIWLGDLNYRNIIPFNDCVNYCRSYNLKALEPCDQLTFERLAWRAFVGFEEGPLNFTPTYRWNRGVTSFSNKRAQPPSWTDRVLYKRSNHEILSLLSYGARHNVISSDHRPVVSFFSFSPLGVDSSSIPPMIPEQPRFGVPALLTHLKDTFITSTSVVKRDLSAVILQPCGCIGDCMCYEKFTLPLPPNLDTNDSTITKVSKHNIPTFDIELCDITLIPLELLPLMKPDKKDKKKGTTSAQQQQQQNIDDINAPYGRGTLHSGVSLTLPDSSIFDDTMTPTGIPSSSSMLHLSIPPPPPPPPPASGSGQMSPITLHVDTNESDVPCSPTSSTIQHPLAPGMLISPSSSSPSSSLHLTAQILIDLFKCNSKNTYNPSIKMLHTLFPFLSAQVPNNGYTSTLSKFEQIKIQNSPIIKGSIKSYYLSLVLSHAMSNKIAVTPPIPQSTHMLDDIESPIVAPASDLAPQSASRSGQFGRFTAPKAAIPSASQQFSAFEPPLTGRASMIGSGQYGATTFPTSLHFFSTDDAMTIRTNCNDIVALGGTSIQVAVSAVASSTKASKKSPEISGYAHIPLRTAARAYALVLNTREPNGRASMASNQRLIEPILVPVINPYGTLCAIMKAGIRVKRGYDHGL